MALEVTRKEVMRWVDRKLVTKGPKALSAMVGGEKLNLEELRDAASVGRPLSEEAYQQLEWAYEGEHAGG